MEKPNKSQGYISFRKSRKKWSARYPEYDSENVKNIWRSKEYKNF